MFTVAVAPRRTVNESRRLEANGDKSRVDRSSSHPRRESSAATFWRLYCVARARARAHAGAAGRSTCKRLATHSDDADCNRRRLWRAHASVQIPCNMQRSSIVNLHKRALAADGSNCSCARSSARFALTDAGGRRLATRAFAAAAMVASSRVVSRRSYWRRLPTVPKSIASVNSYGARARALDVVGCFRGHERRRRRRRRRLWARAACGFRFGSSTRLLARSFARRVARYVAQRNTRYDRFPSTRERAPIEVLVAVKKRRRQPAHIKKSR